MKSGSPFRFPFSLDPLRILLAIRDHWIPLFLLGLLGLGAGGAIGYKLFKKNTYSVAAILRKTGEAEGTSFFGPDAWSPDMLKDEALEQMAMSPRVLKVLGERFDPPETIKQLEQRLEIEYDAAEKLFYLTAKGPTEKLAIVIVNQWADIIVEKTKEHMRAVAGDQALSLRKDLERLDAELIPLNQKIQQLAEEKVIVDETASFAQLSLEIEKLEAELRQYETEEKTFYMRYNKALSALMEHHPLRYDYGRKLQELRLLETRFTRDSPQVTKLQEEVGLLKTQIDRELTGEPTEAQILECARMESAATLYDRYLDLKDQQFRFEEGIHLTQKALEEKRKQMADLPSAAAAFRKVADERAQLIASQNEFRQRLNYAEYYAGEQTPGYLKVFQAADWGLADLATGKYKTIASGLLLAGLAFGTMFLWALLREWRRPEMRTMLQAAITTRTMPKFCLLQKDEEEDETAIREFWLSHLSRQREEGRRILFPVVGELKSEFLFWKTLLQSIKRDNALVLFVDVSQEPVPDSFLKANLLPFTPPSRKHNKASSFLQAGGTGSEDLWKGTSALTSGSSASLMADEDEMDGDGHTAVASPPITALDLTEKPGPSSSSALSTLLQPEDQPLIPTAGNVTHSARYVSAADYSTEQLARLLEDLPPHYYVLCRWAIGPTSSLAAISKHFDQHYLINSPQKTARKTASSQSRIFRRILGIPNGIIFLNEPVKGFVINTINKIQKAYFSWRDDQAPKTAKKTTEDDNEL